MELVAADFDEFVQSERETFAVVAVADRAHAILSASGAHRWMKCTPSARIEEGYPDEGSQFAEQGTYAHAVAANLLREYLGDEPEFIPMELIDKWDDAELMGFVNEYVNFCIEQIEKAREIDPDAQILIEQRMDFSEWVEQGFGTGDVVIITKFYVTVIDLKFGAGVDVDVIDNEQLMIYGLGAWVIARELGATEGIQVVNMVICQPRIGSGEAKVATMDPHELLAWARFVLRPAAKIAWVGGGMYAPGDKTCRFCRARRTCKAREQLAKQTAIHAFKTPMQLTDDEMAVVLSNAAFVKRWCNDVETYALETALEGKRWPGFKLTEGRSNRYITDKEKAAEILLNNMYAEEEIYTAPELVNLSTLERLVGAKRLATLLEDVLHKPKGKPVLVPDTDARVELNTAGAAALAFGPPTED